MAFSKFTSVLRFCQQYGLQADTLQSLFGEASLAPIKPSVRLQEDLAEAKTLPLYTEKAKSELILTPILREVKRRHPGMTFFSGFTLAVEGDPALCGNPDFVLSARPNIVEIEAPIFCMVESKNRGIDEGFAQCAAEMYAAKLFNQQMGEPIETIHGAVTSGFEWVFLRLAESTVYIDRDRYFLSELETLLGILESIIVAFVPSKQPQ